MLILFSVKCRLALNLYSFDNVTLEFSGPDQVVGVFFKSVAESIKRCFQLVPFIVPYKIRWLPYGVTIQMNVIHE